MTLIDNFIKNNCENFNEYIKIKDQIMDLLDESKDVKSRSKLINDKNELEERFFNVALKNYSIKISKQQKMICIEDLIKNNVINNPNIIRVINNSKDAI